MIFLLISILFAFIFQNCCLENGKKQTNNYRSSGIQRAEYHSTEIQSSIIAKYENHAKPISLSIFFSPFSMKIFSGLIQDQSLPCNDPQTHNKIFCIHSRAAFSHQWQKVISCKQLAYNFESPSTVRIWVKLSFWLL